MLSKRFILSCEPGTRVTMRINATETDGDSPDNSVIALTPGNNVATGVGVQLNIDGAPLSLNTNYRVYPYNRTTVTQSRRGCQLSDIHRSR